MILIVRQKGRRRYRQPVEFPLTDSLGISVIRERRQLPDRRKAKTGLIGLIKKLSKKVID
jgi:hypothetical protein